MTIETTLTWYENEDDFPEIGENLLIYLWNEPKKINIGTFICEIIEGEGIYYPDKTYYFLIGEEYFEPREIKYWAKIPEVFNENRD